MYWYLPAWTLGEDNVVVILKCSFDKRHARIILPVAHCLLKQRLVCAWNKTRRCYNIRKTDFVQNSIF